MDCVNSGHQFRSRSVSLALRRGDFARFDEGLESTKVFANGKLRVFAEKRGEHSARGPAGNGVLNGRLDDRAAVARGRNKFHSTADLKTGKIGRASCRERV